ncbi:MAG: septum formation initiator family protein [Lachnospiraceae bacterium]|nr:septum formation initiator family protein [Lachnospiraceae bacterium]
MREEKKKNRSGLVIITLAVMLLCGIVIFKERELTTQKVALEQKCEELNASIDSANELSKELTRKKAYMQTNLYIEDVAREKLGLVYKDEVIFREKNDDD